MRDPNPVVVSRARRRHDHLRARQGDGADRRRVLPQRHQRDARRLDRSIPTSASPSRKPSTSNTGCSRKPSSSACRSRRASRPHRAWSPAAPAASAARPRAGSSPRAPCVVLADIDQAALDEAQAHARQGLRQGQRPRALPWTSPTRRRWRGRSPRRSVEFGGLDILVSNAGIASSAPIEETTLAHVGPQHRRCSRRAISWWRAKPSA